jgi:beta-glucosidase
MPLLTARDLASFDESSAAWVAEAGTYTVKVGASSADIRAAATFMKEEQETVASVSTSVGPAAPAK